jgi:uncharacterized phage-associated protein
VNRDDACDYMITKVCAGGESLSHLKLQKLMYYAQAWHLAFFKTRLFEGKFQAWVHGPVSRDLYDRFAPTKSLYSEITEGDVRAEFDMNSVLEDDASHLNSILEGYAGLTGSQLEEMTHHEDPWVEARGSRRPSERCEVEIDEDLMGRYYARQLG